MTRAGYAIEYDYYVPTQLRPTLAVREAEGLFFAGQINGTTGYEEAAGQGVLAGINAAAHALGKDEVVLGRESSFIGVLVDDLVTRGVDEPYRLFTSRSEFRLSVRQDNALRRVGTVAAANGMLGPAEAGAVSRRIDDEAALLARARSESLAPEFANPVLAAAEEKSITQPQRIAELAKRPGVSLAALMRAAGIREFDGDAALTAELELKYAGYFERERVQAERLRKMRDVRLPADLDYLSMRSLSTEARQKLARARPEILAHAANIPGITAADLQNLVIEVERHRRAATVN